MPYPAINARRMPYDIDGCEIGFRNAVNYSVSDAFSFGIASWLSSASKGNLNSVQRTEVWSSGGAWYDDPCQGFWFFFPEQREITDLALYFTIDTSEISAWATDTVLQGSNDTTNGMDGTWEAATVNIPLPRRDTDYWRSTIAAVSFSGPKKVIRIGLRHTEGPNTQLTGIHLYGRKAAGQTPDDILFCDTSGVELTALKDWGDRPEGTTQIWSFKLKNASTGKIANNVNIQLNHSDFAIAWAADGPWQSVLDIASIGVGALSNTIYIRNQLAPPLLTLGPVQARVIATVGSWT